MSQGFGIASIVLVIISFFIPGAGVYITALAMIFATVSARGGDRVLATVTGLLGATNLILFSPAFLLVFAVALDNWMMPNLPIYVIVLISPALPFVVMMMNTTDKSVLGKSSDEN